MKNMKRMMAALVATAVCLSASSQILVTSNGNVGVGSTNPLSKLSVNADGNALFGMRINNPTATAGAAGLYATTSVLPPGSSPSNNNYSSVRGQIASGHGYAFSIFSQSVNATPQTSGRAYGVYGEASNATSGYNYGVFGVLPGSNNGAAVYGTTNLNDVWGENTNGKFAGYFSGAVHVTGALTIDDALNIDGEAFMASLYQFSDARLKENVLGLSSALDNLRQLRGVTYNLKKPELELPDMTNPNDTGAVKTKPVEDISRYTQKRIGFIAQELQSYYPELVREDGDGMLAVDYNGLIPVIVEAIKEQDNIINALKLELESLRSALPSSPAKQQRQAASLSNNASTADAVLYQNAPNPFNTSTEIRYYIPDQVQQAVIYVFNMQGTLLRTNALHDRGNGQITVNASELKPGMYLYSLVADGKEMDTKRMILTE